MKSHTRKVTTLCTTQEYFNNFGIQNDLPTLLKLSESLDAWRFKEITSVLDEFCNRTEIETHTFILFRNTIYTTTFKVLCKQRCRLNLYVSLRRITCSFYRFLRRLIVLIRKENRLVHIFRIHFLNYFIKNSQNIIAPTFLTHTISAIGGVYYALE